jgi:dTDP-4-dehydrorhamnose 3,5-epimerase
VQTTPLDIPHALHIQPVVHGDDRGAFLEWFRADVLAEAAGRRFDTVQANLSVSRRGTVRGVHFADVPPGQAKYVTVVHGAVRDILVDLRVGSPTFGTWQAVELDAEGHAALYLPEGIGHLFAVTSDTATVCYLTTDVYRPDRERTLSPLDAELGLELGLGPVEPVLSDRDRAAPGLAELRDAGLLPGWDACLARYAEAAA